LVEAHAHNDIAKMQESDRLLGEIEAAWLAIPGAG
jgi:flagellin-specific chaperone FliS